MNLIDTLKGAEKSTGVAGFSDPFSREGVRGVHLHVTRWLPGQPVRLWARIEFENGKTKGEQEIDAPDFATLVARVSAFVEGLRA